MVIKFAVKTLTISIYDLLHKTTRRSRALNRSKYAKRRVGTAQESDTFLSYLRVSWHPLSGLSQMDVTQVPQSPSPSEMYRSILKRPTRFPKPLL